MTFFADERALGYRRQSRRGQIAIWLFVIVALICTMIVLSPAPYVIQAPGHAYDTLGTVTPEGKTAVPMISIPGEQTYPTDGEFNLLTVTSLGTPRSLPTWLEVLQSWVDPSRTAVPVGEVYPDDITLEEILAANEEQMQQSQQAAIAAALTSLEREFTTTISVGAVSASSNAFEVLQEGDILRTINEEPITSLPMLHAAVAANGAQQPAVLGIMRESKDETVEVQPIRQDGQVLLGIGVQVQYDFPVQVTIQLDEVGGPSAGLMFSLGIIDKLTEGSLNGGEIVAGTGTIDALGTVGPIGGVRQKLFAAVAANATWMLVPSRNCQELNGIVPAGITVVPVANLDDALRALEVAASGTDSTAGLRTCG